MGTDEHRVLTIAEILSESAAMTEAALARDFDEARFRAQLIVAKADAAGLVDAVLAAALVLKTLGPTDTVPTAGYGAGMLRIEDELGRARFGAV